MKIVSQVRLLPTPEQATALAKTMRACNTAANRISERAYRGDAAPTRARLQRIAYRDLKNQGLSAQSALHVIRKVADAYSALRANLKAGNLGKPGSRRRVRAESKPIAFRPDAAQPFDDRCLSWQHDAGTVSIWTVHGRMKGLRFTGGADQLKTLREHRRGETDLVCRDGVFYLAASCDVPEAELNEQPAGWLGVDLGIVNVATTSDGKIRSSRGRNRQRAAVHSWPFAQLAAFIAYKARIAGVPVAYVDPAYTSQECSYCHHVDKRNRPNQAVFRCRSCGVVAHADWNASRNIAARGEKAWTAGRQSRVPAPS